MFTCRTPVAPWVTDFIEECAAFPNGTHDDQVDAMTQALLRWNLLPRQQPVYYYEPYQSVRFDRTTAIPGGL